MRDSLRRLVHEGAVPDHFALAYSAWAPIEVTGHDAGKLVGETRSRWLKKLSDISIAPDYRAAFDRWKATFDRPSDRLLEFTSVSRLLVGHGNASATDVGLLVNHTWGVPMIPGSAIKGLVAHYASTTYGPDDPCLAPADQPVAERDHIRWQSHVRDEKERIVRGPGETYRLIFGAADSTNSGEQDYAEFDPAATAGLVNFHDALYVPGSASEDKPFALDVLTVHQQEYYRTSGSLWPNDYDSPNPVSFITVRPAVSLAFPLSGPAELLAPVERLLTEALREWGIGGKTSTGYGRFDRRLRVSAVQSLDSRSKPRARHKVGDKIVVECVQDPTGKNQQRFRADDGVLGLIIGGGPAVEIGKTLDLWVANVGDGLYTLTAKPIQPKSKGPKR